MAAPPNWLKYLPPIIGGLVSVTASVIVQSLGPLAIATVWLSVVLAIVSLYAAWWRGELRRVEEEVRKAPPPASTTRPDQDAHIRELEGEVMSLEGEIVSAKEALADEKERGLRTARALAASESDSQKLARELEQLKEAVGKDKDVLLLTDLTVSDDQPMDFVSKRLRRGTVIEILAQSPSKFSFDLFDSENIDRVLKGRQNYESSAGKENTSIYKERYTIPRGDDWFFVVTQTGEGKRAEIRLVVTLIETAE